MVRVVVGFRLGCERLI